MGICFSILQKKNNNNDNNNSSNVVEKKEGGENKKGGDGGGKKQENKPIPVVLKVEMHCEGCVSTILKHARAFEGTRFLWYLWLFPLLMQNSLVSSQYFIAIPVLLLGF